MTALNRQTVVRALREVQDPCMVAAGLDVSIVDMGLIYGVQVERGMVQIQITFTEPGCPYTHQVMGGVYDKLEALAGVTQVDVQPCWLPVWTEDCMTDDARRQFEAARSRLRHRQHPVVMQPSASIATKI